MKIKIIREKIYYFLPVLSGLLLMSISPPLNFGWLSFFALIPFLYFLSAESSLRRSESEVSGSVRQLADGEKTGNRKKAFFGGAILGFVYFLGVLYPLTSIDWYGFRSDSLISQKVFLFAAWPVLSLFGSLFFAAASLIFTELRKKNPLGSPTSKYGGLILFPAIFVLLTEFLRSIFIFQFTWGFVGYSLHNVFYLPQLAAFGGIYLLSFLVYFFNVAIYLATKQSSWKAALKWGGAVAVLFLVLNYVGFNHYVLLKEKISSASGEMKVAVLQGNIKQPAVLTGSKLYMEKAYSEMIDEAVGQSAKIIALPEGFVPGDIAFSEKYLPIFEYEAKDKIENFWREKLSGNDGAISVFGSGVLENKKNYNALLFADAGGIFGKYYKRELVPFGEYHPAITAKLAPESFFNRSAGAEAAVAEHNGVKYAGLICNESLYPYLWRESVLAGANVLINAGNDGVFGSQSAAVIMEIATEIRAIETGRFVVRAMRTGISAVFEPTGEETARAGFNESALLFSKVKPLSGLTFYGRFGDWILILSSAIVALYFIKRYNYN